MFYRHFTHHGLLIDSCVWGVLLSSCDASGYRVYHLSINFLLYLMFFCSVSEEYLVNAKFIHMLDTESPADTCIRDIVVVCRGMQRHCRASIYYYRILGCVSMSVFVKQVLVLGERKRGRESFFIFT